ncbi:hypothetical protein [Streptomyces flavofungini]|uniref:hypothetical protein n=1 Tax=Streptomyces flavofungini TaxID=68200 RepID=UPI0034DFC199
MTSPQPERHRIHAAPAAGQTEPTDADRETVRRLFAAVDEIPTSFRDHTPTPMIGTAPPVPQPGRPPMSQRATDASAMMVAGGFLSLCLGAAVSAVLYFSGSANPVVVGLICLAPPAVFLSARGLLKSFRSAAPLEIHNHYEGTVHQDQRTVHTSTRGVWAKTTNQQ